MEKPDVLSDEEKLTCSLVDDRHTYKELKAVIDETCVHQRDADVEWYGDMVMRVTERAVKVGEATLNKVYKAHEQEIKQARQDTAREIFGAIKRAYRHKDQHYMVDGMIDREFRCVSEHSIEALESKFLTPPNPVGNA